MFSQILGQEKAKKFLKHVIGREQMPHAYLFTGISGIGKTSTAMALAMALNCNAPVNGEGCGHCQPCRRIVGGNSPDFLSISAKPDKKNISIEQIRDLNRELNFAPMGKCRVSVICQAQAMTAEAANAFLKTLEEPPLGNILVLNAVDPRDLLPTIVSRCQRVPFQPVPINDMINWLVKERQVNEEAARVLARISGGSLGLALKMFEGDFLDKRQAWLSMIVKLPGISQKKAMEMAFQCADEAKRIPLLDISNSGEPGMLDMLGVWKTWYRDMLLVQVNGSMDLLINADFSRRLQNIAGDFIIKGLIDSLLVLDQAGRDLGRNRNTSLVMEHTVLRLKQIADAQGAERIEQSA